MDLTHHQAQYIVLSHFQCGFISEPRTPLAATYFLRNYLSMGPEVRRITADRAVSRLDFNRYTWYSNTEFGQNQCVEFIHLVVHLVYRPTPTVDRT